MNGLAFEAGCEIVEAAPLAIAAAHSTFAKPEITPASSLLADAVGLAEAVIRHSAAAVAACLNAVTRGINLSVDEALAVEASWFAIAVSTGDVAADLDRFFTRKRR